MTINNNINILITTQNETIQTNFDQKINEIEPITIEKDEIRHIIY